HPSTIEVIYNVIDFEKYNSKALSDSSLLEEFPTLENKILVGLVGRIAKVKGIEDYVEAAIDVIMERDDVGFLIVGPEEDKTLGQKVRKRVNSLHLTDKIIFTGYREDIPTLLQQMDLVVCSSRKEGFSYSCLEAMAASKAIVTTKCGGPEEIVVHSDTGYLVEVGRPKELAEAILLMIRDPDKLKIMGTKGRQRSEQIFDARTYARNFERLYLEVIKQELPRDLCKEPWGELVLHLTTNLGTLGVKVIDHEHEIRDLRNFEALLKNNLLYRSLKKCIRLVKS
ncbi:glycosyltransferase family 4 protein, partial [bacterium]|nr:glycosyltransferase family 4 protein [bacterium]